MGISPIPYVQVQSKVDLKVASYGSPFSPRTLLTLSISAMEPKSHVVHTLNIYAVGICGTLLFL